MTTSKRPDTPGLAPLARRQHWVVTHRQLLGLGLTRSAIRWLVADGRLYPQHLGVYAVGRPALSREGSWMAAVLAAGDGAGLALGPAGLLWSVLERGDERPHVIVPSHAGRRRRPGMTVHRSRILTPDDIVVRNGIPVTTLNRTLWDLAGGLAHLPLKAAVRQGVRLHRLDLGVLRATVQDRPDRRSRRLMRVIALYLPDEDLTESELELRFYELCRRRRLPLPELQSRHGRRRVDFVWHDCRLIVETDGSDHLGLIAAGEDRAKDRALLLSGYAVLRFTWADIVNRPAETASELRAHRAHRFAELGLPARGVGRAPARA